MIQQVKTVTLPLVWTNGFFLLFITFLPFPTSLVAEHLTSPSGSLAVAIYAATNVCISLTYLYLYTVSSQGDTEPSRLRYARLNALGGIAICSACIGLAFVSKMLALLLIGAVWVWWSLPQRVESPQAAPD